jgi:predicted ester cyclase
MFPDCKMEIARIYGVGDWVCAECIESGTMGGPIKHAGGEVPATGKFYKISNIIVCRMDGGKIAEVRCFFDVLDLMSQLGLRA